MEWGPRALGNRSILGDPRRADMKAILNQKIKRRESFRPFAPAILEEAVGDWSRLELAALEVAEATYLMCDTDAEGQMLDGRHRYVLRFAAGQLPPAHAFWSLTMYEVTPEGRAFFTDNPLSRYAIGDRTRGLVQDADGSLEIYLQHDRPDEDRTANWLPAPAGPMRLVLRAYEPADSLIDGTWPAPAVTRAG